MNIFDSRRGHVGLVMRQVAYVLLCTLLLWAMRAPTFLNYAKAANLTLVSDTLSDSQPDHFAKNVINFTMGTTTAAGQTIKITFDPITSSFIEAFSSATTTDITTTGMTLVTNLGACPGSGTNVYATGNYNTNDTNENITFTVCPGNTILAGAKVITLGAVTPNIIRSPVGVGSYRIVIGGTQPDSGETRVAIINNVVVTASVDTSFTFTISGLASGTSINGTTTSTTTSATAIAFGTLQPGVPVVAGQHLTVATNARNGFVVTVQENQPLTSSTGATIDLFKDGATTTTPVPFTAPSGQLDKQWTYGHIGLTSNDVDLNSGEFVATTTTPFAGNFDVPRQVFSHTGPSDGTTANKGKADVAYEVQITALQEAGNDYTNTLTYVATPTF